MPLIQIDDTICPYLVYEAPVDEKTKEIRKMFKVDENTGYPEHYNWRPMARLGTEYELWEPFEKLGEFNPEEQISTKVTMAGLVIAASCGMHWMLNFKQGKPWYARIHRIFISSALFYAALGWTAEKTLQRQAQKNHILIDYVKKHPERFEKIRRPKYRESLFEYIATR